MLGTLNQVRIFVSEFHVEDKTPIVKRKFKDGRRKGRDKSPVKSYRLKTRLVPRSDLLFVPSQNFAVCHPKYYGRIVDALNSPAEVPTGDDRLPSFIPSRLW